MDRNTDNASRSAPVEALRWANLSLAFILELCLLAAVGYWGFMAGPNTALKLLLGLGGPVLVAIFWGMVLAPRTPLRPPEWLHLLLVIAAFALGVAALVAAGQPGLGLALAVVFAVNRVLLYVWR